jgi:hypothetical protein
MQDHLRDVVRHRRPVVVPPRLKPRRLDDLICQLPNAAFVHRLCGEVAIVGKTPFRAQVRQFP